MECNNNFRSQNWFRRVILKRRLSTDVWMALGLSIPVSGARGLGGEEIVQNPPCIPIQLFMIDHFPSSLLFSVRAGPLSVIRWVSP